MSAFGGKADIRSVASEGSSDRILLEGGTNSRRRLRVGQNAIDRLGREPTELVFVLHDRPGGRSM